MDWNECIEEAKEDLGISGWCNNWDEVVDLAKEKYWKGDAFKDLKESTIEIANGECQLCSSTTKLTAHHINYGNNEETICVCKGCHEIIHSPEISRYGFVLQHVLFCIVRNEKWAENLYSICYTCQEKLLDKVCAGKKGKGREKQCSLI